MRGQSKVKIRKSKIVGVLLWRSTAILKKIGRNRILCQFKAKWLYFQIQKKINTKYWIVFAVEPFKKRCDNFDAEFIITAFCYSLWRCPLVLCVFIFTWVRDAECSDLLGEKRENFMSDSQYLWSLIPFSKLFTLVHFCFMNQISSTK